MPTVTFNIATSLDDGAVYKTGAAYPPATGPTVDDGGTEVNIHRSLSGGTTFIIANGMMRWDTSSLPDGATVTAATLRVYVTSKSDSNSRNLTADWYTAWPIDTGDYSEAAQTGALSTAISGITAAAYNDFALSDVAANVSLTGYTGLRLHVDGVAPTNTNYVFIAAYDHATFTEPQLIVDYVLNTTVDTPAATAGASAPAPTIVIPISVSAVPAQAGASAPAPSVNISNTITAPAAQAGASAPVPAVNISVAIAGVAAQAGASAPTPTVTVIQNITIAPPAAQAGATFSVPAVAAHVNITMTIAVTPRAVTGTVLPREVTGTYSPRTVTGVIVP